jgi:hypothetical protein
MEMLCPPEPLAKVGENVVPTGVVTKLGDNGKKKIIKWR